MVMTFPSFLKRLPPNWYEKGGHMYEMMEKAAGCIQCGECEARCPYHLPIMDMIEENYKLFEETVKKQQK